MSEKIKPKGKKTWIRTVIILIILGIIGITGYYYLTNRRQEQAMETLRNLETVVYGKGSLSASISGTGTVRANQQIVLTWSTSGTVGDINVSLGEKVSKGDILISLDEGNLPIDILQAQIDVITIQNSLDALYENNDLKLAQAEYDLIIAQKNLEQAQDDRRVMNYGRCTDERIADLQEEYDDALEVHKRFATDATLQAVDIALANLNFCKADFTDEEVAEADARLKLTEEKVKNLEASISSLQNGPDLDEVSILETQLKIAEARLARKEITAPFNGIVTGLYAMAGDQVNTGTKAVQLADLSKLYVDVQISEVDIPLVQVGQDVELVFDAYFEDTYRGSVIEITPVGTEIQGVVTYNVTVVLLEGLDKIKSGMTAAINIITEEKKDVFVVPSAALTTNGGKDQVYVMRNSMPVAVEVVVGAFSDDMVEIIEAEIEEGETILINPPTSVLSIMEQNSRVPAFMRGN